ncbi:MAG: DNA polymerase III subunit delta [Gemmatimonadetes bacterium]|nr:DNA polymerase III subunit delta [Gemmatimonadota bacterium]
MGQLSTGKLAALLAAPPAAAVFFLHGEEEHLRDEAATRIVDAFVDPATRDFNYDQLRGADLDAEALASIIATPPLMATYRVLVIRDAQGLSARAREVVEETAGAAPPGLILVVIAQIPSGSKAKFYTTLQQRALSVQFSAVDPLDLPGWLSEHAAEKHGVELELDAARALVGGVGNQLGILTSELEKLAAYVEGRPRISLDDVRAVGGYVPRVDRWAWFDLVTEKRFPEALRTLPDMLAAGENGVGIVIGASTQIVRVGLVIAGGREMLERELKGYQRFLASRLVSAARAWKADEVDLAIGELLRTDRLLKSASLNDRQALEELLLRLAEGVGTRRNAA